MARLTYVLDTRCNRVISTQNPEIWEGETYKRLPAKDGAKMLSDQARDELREMLPIGAVVYSILRSVATSGMSRRVSFKIIQDGRMRDITALMVDAGSAMRLSDKEGATIQGGGMDMGFHEVYNLGRRLYPLGDLTRPGQDGGYTLKHEWL